MSRLIIKGLPARYKDENLRQLFSFAGQVTDAKVMHTNDGRSRQFGFVGFRTAKEARLAKTRLHKSFVDTSRVTVEEARAVGAQDLPRPWSKYSKGSSRFELRQDKTEENERKTFLKKEKERLQRLKEEQQQAKDNQVSKNQAKTSRAADDHVWDAFQEVAERRSANPVWADGAIRATQVTSLVESRKHGSKGKMLERKHVTFGDSDDDDDDEMYEQLPKQESREKQDQDICGKVALDQKVSDMDYFKSKIVSGTELDQGDQENDDSSDARIEQVDGNGSHQDSDEESESDEDSDVNSIDSPHTTTGQSKLIDKPIPGNSGEKRDSSDQSVDNRLTAPRKNDRARFDSEQADASETGRLLVRNIAFSMTEEELETIFEPFGVLADVHVVRDKTTSKSRGMAFVQYMHPEDAVRAMTDLDGSFQSGRILHILPAKPKPQTPTAHKMKTTPGTSAFKEKRESEQKDAARSGLDSVAQDPMHVSANAVAEIVADRHGVSKAELLGTTLGESGTAAVRLAVAEATIQSETQKYLAQRGVNLVKALAVAEEIAANTGVAKRKRLSRTAFLVKNLPARTREADLKQVFGKFGNLARVIVVPSGLLSVVEFKTATDAKRAYNNLAYTKFRDTPLYLEWLPSEAIGPVLSDDGKNTAAEADDAEDDIRNKAADTEDPTDEVDTSSTVYVKNLNFETRDAQLKEHFLGALRKRPNLARSLRSAKVAMKKGPPGKETEMLSMGFGFLEFVSRADAIEAVKVVQNSKLDGHVLQLRLSNPTGVNSSPGSRKRRKSSSKNTKVGPKLIARNLAFEATRKDVRQLFSSFGQLKTVRLPKKADGSHRGFAFVEFVSKSEAKAAVKALQSAHLYGRHLVVDYADETTMVGSSVEELQHRTAVHVQKKRIRLNNGSLGALSNEEEHGEYQKDEEERMRDALYA